MSGRIERGELRGGEGERGREGERERERVCVYEGKRHWEKL
jgi:hypothetical protein